MYKANLTKLAALKDEAKALDLKIKNLQSKIVTEFDSEGIDRVTHNGHTFTVVRGERVTVDVGVLRNLVGDQMFAHLTKVTVDTTAFNNAAFTGLIDAQTVAACATYRATSAYVRIS